MTITVWPVDAVAGAPSYTGRMLREAQSVFMAGASTADPFGVRSGVRPGTSTTTITATSTTWTVAAHAGALDLETAVEASGYAYAVNATGGLPTGAVTAANATYPRHDVVYAHLDDPAESDGSSVPAVTFTYLAGTVLTAGTLEVSAVPARSVAYATISVPISGGGSPTVIWTAPYTVAAGAPTPVWSQADRDAKFPTPYDGLGARRLDTHLTETYDGTGWAQPSPVVTFASGTGNNVANAVVIIPDVTLPAVSHATRVIVQVEGVAGFGTVAANVGLQINGSAAVTQRAAGADMAYAVAAKYIGVTNSGYMDIPANTVGTVQVASMLGGATTAYFRAGMTITRVNN